MISNKSGFSIPELLITMAISTIIIGAAFGSYMIVSHNYRVQKDIRYMANLAQPVVEMMAKDIRMAGYRDDTAAGISNPITITDSNDDCCDRIKIIYDIGNATDGTWDRHLIEYFTQDTFHNAEDVRRRLYKRIRECADSNCTTFTTTDPLPASPIADYVEDLQFVGTNGNCAQGDVKYGCGKEMWLYPSHNASVTGEVQTVGNAVNTAFWPEDPNTKAEWNSQDAVFRVGFDMPIRITKIKVGPPPAWTDVPVGTDWYNAPLTYDPWQDFENLNHPYGFSSDGFTTNISIEKVGVTRCVWQGGCHGTTDGILPSPVDTSRGGLFFQIEQECDLTLTNVMPPSGCGMGGSTVEFLSAVTEPYIESGRTSFVRISLTSFLCGISRSNASGTTCLGMSYDQTPSLTDIRFYGEVFGMPINAQEVDVGLVLRSPSEHGSVNRIGTKSLGNRTISWDDRYIRDFFSTSVVMRNLYYQSQ